MPKLYRYVGPAEIQRRATGVPAPPPIGSPGELLDRLQELGFQPRLGCPFTVTFVIAPDERLRIADRRSEHVTCAGNGEVLSAGEMTFGWGAEACIVENVTNQSTGYCPDAESWTAVDCALKKLAVWHPTNFEPIFEFRRCPHCQQTNIIKDGWFVCSMCGAGLPMWWNYS